MQLVLAGLLLAAAVGGARADELADAAKALDSGDYPKAVAIYTRLADAGNAKAQFHLGELYWYGEGVALDREKGDALFAKAAAGGDAEASAATALSAQRAARLADIAAWTTHYNGRDMVSGKFACVAPVMPAVSKTNAEIKSLAASYDAYVACYNGYVDNLASAMPAGKRLPNEVAIVMSEQELTQAKRRLETVYAGLARSGAQEADQAMRQHTAWVAATEAYVAAENVEIAKRTKQAQLEIDASKRMHEQSLSLNRDVPNMAPSKR
jgi:TPR repeat protein